MFLSSFAGGEGEGDKREKGGDKYAQYLLLSV